MQSREYTPISFQLVDFEVVDDEGVLQIQYAELLRLLARNELYNVSMRSETELLATGKKNK